MQERDTEQENAKWLKQTNVENTHCQAGLAVNFQWYFTSKTKIKAVIMRIGDWPKRIISSLAIPLRGRSEPSAYSTTINELFLQMRQAKIWERKAEKTAMCGATDGSDRIRWDDNNR